MTHEGMELAKTPGLYTYFNANAKSIIDLTFHRGLCSNMIQKWDIDPEGHGSDHLPTSTTWHIPKNQHTPSRMWRKADWKAIHNAFQNIQFPPPSWEAEDTLLAVNKLHNCVTECIEQHVPWSKPGPARKRWWTKELNVVRTNMRRRSQKVRQPRALDQDKAAAKTATTTWRKAVNEAKRNYWETELR